MGYEKIYAWKSFKKIKEEGQSAFYETENHFVCMNCWNEIENLDENTTKCPHCGTDFTKKEGDSE